MYREIWIMLGSRALSILWLLSIVSMALVQTTFVVGICSIACGVWSIMFRRELARYYAKAPYLFGRYRGNYSNPTFHLAIGAGLLTIGCLYVLFALGALLKLQ
jgi:hypothetical protein